VNLATIGLSETKLHLKVKKIFRPIYNPVKIDIRIAGQTRFTKSVQRSCRISAFGAISIHHQQPGCDCCEQEVFHLKVQIATVITMTKISLSIFLIQKTYFMPVINLLTGLEKAKRSMPVPSAVRTICKYWAGIFSTASALNSPAIKPAITLPREAPRNQIPII